MTFDRITWPELIALQTYLGSPIYLTAVLLLGWFLWSVRRAGFLRVLLAALVFLAGADILSIFIWIKWPFHRDIMAFRYLNLPALIAGLAVFPMVAAIFSIFIKGQKPRGRA